MSKKSKLFERLKANPKGATFAAIRKLLLQEGFELDRIGVLWQRFFSKPQ